MQAVDDKRLFCELCQLYFSDACPAHGPPHFVRDTPVSEGVGQSAGGSRAMCTLPQCLVLVERSQDPAGELGVFSQALLPHGWIFGPYEGEGLLSRRACTKYSWAIKDKGFFFYVDASDESKSNWMRYVSCASSEEEQNLTVFQYHGRIYYRVSKPIPAGTELRVWIGREYATMLGLQLGDHIKFEYGEKEILMKIFQDIQVVSVSDSNPQASTDGKADSGDPLANPQAGGSSIVISEVYSEAQSISAPGDDRSSPQSQVPQPVSSTIPGVNPPPPPQHPDSSASPNRVTLKFNFVKGAESLVSLSRAQSRYWTFFGFEANRFGQFLDKTKIICKLCGGRLAYSGNTTNLRQHLIYKHRQEFNQLMDSGVPAANQTTSLSPVVAFNSGSQKASQRSPQQTVLPSNFLSPRPPRSGEGSTSVSSSVSNKALPPPATVEQVAPSHVSSVSSVLATSSIADFLVRDLLPPETVDGEGFRQLMSTLLPCYEVPSGDSLAQTVLSKAYEQGRMRWARLLRDALGAAADSPLEKSEVTRSPEAKAKSEHSHSSSGLDSSTASPTSDVLWLSAPKPTEAPARSRVAVSAEVWRHGWRSGANYVTLSAHFVDEDFNQHNLTLASQRLEESAEEAEGEEGRVRAAEHKVREMASEWGISEPSFLLLGGERGVWEKKEGNEGVSTPHPNTAASSARDESALTGESSGLGSENILSGDPHSFPAPGTDSKTRMAEEGSGSSSSAGKPVQTWPPISCVFTVLRECVEQLLQHPAVSTALRRCKALVSKVLTFTLHEKNGSSPSSSSPSLSPRLLQLLGDPVIKSLLKSWAEGGPLWNALYTLIQTLSDNRDVFCQILEELADDTRSSGSCSVRAVITPSPQISSNTNTTDVPDLLDNHNTTSASVSDVDANATVFLPAFPESSDWSLLRELCTLLRPLDVACSTLAREQFPRLSLVKPVLTSLLSRHFALQPDDSPFRLEAKRAVRDRLTRRYSDPEVKRALNLVCALDPRFQGLEFLEVGERAETFSWLKKEAVRLAEKQRPGVGVGEVDGRRKDKPKRRTPSPLFGEAESSRKKARQGGVVGGDPEGQKTRDGPPLDPKGDFDGEHKEFDAAVILEDHDNERENEKEASLTAPSSGPSSKEKSLSDMEFLLGGLCASRPQTTHCSVTQQVEREVAIFRAEAGAELGEEPLQWWRARAAQLPLLAQVARIYLAAPATAGHAPRLFSQSGGEGGAMFRKRANIPPELLDQLLFLHDNRLSASRHGSVGSVKK